MESRRSFFGKVFASVAGLLGLGAVGKAVADDGMIHVLDHLALGGSFVEGGGEEKILLILQLSPGEYWDEVNTVFHDRLKDLRPGWIRETVAWKGDCLYEGEDGYTYSKGGSLRVSYVDRKIYYKV